jgi:hypothetical protein
MLSFDLAVIATKAATLLEEAEPLLEIADYQRRIDAAGWKWRSQDGWTGCNIRIQGQQQWVVFDEWRAAAAHAEANRVEAMADQPPEPDEPTLAEKFDAASEPGLLGVPTIGVSEAIGILEEEAQSCPISEKCLTCTEYVGNGDVCTGANYVEPMSWRPVIPHSAVKGPRFASLLRDCAPYHGIGGKPRGECAQCGGWVRDGEGKWLPKVDSVWEGYRFHDEACAEAWDAARRAKFPGAVVLPEHLAHADRVYEEGREAQREAAEADADALSGPPDGDCESRCCVMVELYREQERQIETLLAQVASGEDRCVQSGAASPPAGCV